MDEIRSPLPPRKIPGAEDIKKEEKKNETEPAGRQSLTGEPAQKAPEEKKPGLPIKEGGIPKILVVIIVVLVIIGGGMVAAKNFLGGNKGGDQKKETVINYWGLWEDSNIIEGVIAEFEEKNPGIKINYTKNSPVNYRSKLLGRLGKDPANVEVPDIFRIHNTWVNGFDGELAGVPKQTADNLSLDNDFFDVYGRDLKIKGNWKAVPLMYDGLALFYNPDLLGANSKPRTWWGLESLAAKLTARGENDEIQIAGAGIGMVNNVDHWSDIVGLMMMQNGVEPLKNSEVNNKKLEDVLAYYTLFATKHRVWDESLPSTTQMFANGRLVFYFAPSWRIFNLEEINPGLNYRVTSVPQLPTLQGVSPDEIEYSDDEDNITDIHWASYWVEGVNNKSSKQTAAWKFLEFLASKEGLEKMYQTASQVRSFGEIYPRKSMAELLADNQKLEPFVSNANKASSWYLASRTFDDGVNEEMGKYFKDAINSIVLNNNDSSSAVETLRQGMDQLAGKYKLSQ